MVLKWCTGLHYLVGGYHKYKDVCSAPIDRVEIPCEREPGNPRDKFQRVIAAEHILEPFDNPPFTLFGV